MSVIVALVLLGLFVGWMVCDGALWQQKHRDWPRGRIATIVGFAYSLRLWSRQDQFGLKTDETKPQPPTKPIVALRLEEITEQRTQRTVEQKTKVQEILGG